MTNEMTMSGLFLSLDGLDGTGKSTQARLLAEWLRGQGKTVVECADPGGTPIGGIIRDLLLGHRQEMAVTCEALLFMASRAQLTAEIIRPALAKGNVIVSDRYLLANVVYQGYGGGLDEEFLWQAGRLATGGLEPDLTIVLDLNVETAFARRKVGPADRVESRDTAYQARVRAGFLAEAMRRPEKIVVVDAAMSTAEIHERICREVSRVLDKDPRA
jgi:dTMP kinase